MEGSRGAHPSHPTQTGFRQVASILPRALPVVNDSTTILHRTDRAFVMDHRADDLNMKSSSHSPECGFPRLANLATSHFKVGGPLAGYGGIGGFDDADEFVRR